MTITTAQPREAIPTHVSGPRSFGWWGMVCLIATEATLFAVLIASYFYLRFQNGRQWPPAGIEDPALTLPLVMSAILWTSSVPVHLADRAIRKGNVRRLKLGLLAGSVLGVVFIAMQLGIEYPQALDEFTPRTNSYGSMFFTITGFHGAHVIVGLLMSAWTQVRAWTGAFDADRHVTVQIFTMYWHFVDVVWLFVLATIYISPHV